MSYIYYIYTTGMYILAWMDLMVKIPDPAGVKFPTLCPLFQKGYLPQLVFISCCKLIFSQLPM
jgi:hypothetical protein